MKRNPVKSYLTASLIILFGFMQAFAQQQWNPGHAIGSVNGAYNVAYNQTAPQLVEIYPAAIPNTGVSYQWESCATPTGTFTPVASGGNASSYSPGVLTQTMYYMRVSTISGLGSVNSNVVRLKVVSVNWEDVNYVREHDVLTNNTITWTSVDQMTIGQKLQSTNYLDGLGRSVEKISRETATPPQGQSQWGDLVSFHQYDAFGREASRYLPYSTTNQSKFYKTAPVTDQAAYYSNANTYNESSPYSSLTFDNSPLNRIKLIKESGTAWAASVGDSCIFDLNATTDSVQIFYTDYVQAHAPVDLGAYPANTLYKITYLDVNRKKVVEYKDQQGQLILRKVQIDPTPTTGHAGWACNYFVYDDFGLLRFQVQPEGVKYLIANSWSFAGTNGTTVLNEWCFQFYFDDKGRTVWKKAPGANPLNLLYDIRDRLVFTQDGNQSAMSTPQWTASLYDELDRNIISTLYNTTKTVAQLQTDIANSVSTSTVTTSTTGTAVNDLIVNSRNTSIATYSARNTVTLANGFSSGSTDSYTVQIDPNATSASYSVTTAFFNNPIASTDLSNSAVTTILKYRFYDDYTFSSSRPFDNGNTNLSAYSTSDPNVIPIANSVRTLSLSTGSMTRVLGTSIFLCTTNYFDEKGRHIQSSEDNIKSGTDITTYQYHFDGRLLSVCMNHAAPGTDYTGFITLTKFLFDNIGRRTSTQKQYGTNAFKTINTDDYDDLGRIKTKHLDPGYNNPNSGQPDLEGLNYSYNIHGQITGINKDYALKTPATYNKWAHFFGQYLGFDNRDNTFNAPQLNGQVTGILWNTQGDDAQRKYDYTYDNAYRLINAVYKEQPHPGDGYSNSKMDFSVSGTSGQMTYDYNGNILTMLQKGVVPGTTSPLVVDDLRYTYASFSNKLQSVTDMMTTTTLNGQFGDFKDGTNGSTPDYVYDNNGNLIIDLNKNIQSLNNGAAGTPGVSYNFLDKPDQIRVVGKGTIKIVYSADGEKLQRVYIPESGTSNITSYLGEFIYQESATLTLTSPAPFSGTNPVLAYINFEEGRVRVMQPTSTSNGFDALSENGNVTLPNGKMGAYDYFVLDYQGSVRMILTEETHSATNTCTMETTRQSAETPVFGQPGASNEVLTTQYGKPAGWSNNSTAMVSRLGHIAGHFIGPNSLQKVMAGDLVSASVQYYYAGAVTGTNPDIITPLLSSLVGAIGGTSTVGTLVHSNGTAISSQLNGTPAFITAVEPSNNTSGTPQAYLTILFFDERFNFIASADGGVAQQQVASSWSTGTPPLGLVNIKAPKNGYVYIYISNRSEQDVYFDNLVVTIAAGNIIEEDHYYSFGLRIAALSSKKLGDIAEGKLSNPYLFHDKEMLDEDAGLNWYDYGYRNYDPQIGRFVQLDPLTDEYPEYSPYQFAGNDPIANVDLDGLEPSSVISFVKSLGSDAGDATAKIISSGKWAGHWAVSWTSADGIAHSMIFKSLGKFATTTQKVMQVAGKVAETVVQVIPFASGAYDIYQGVKSGNGWQVAMGVGSMVLDFFSFGGATLAKGAIKIAVKEGAEILIKDAAEQGIKKTIETGGKEVLEQGVKEGVEKGSKDAAEGIVYKRTNPKTGEEYIGQAKSDSRYLQRQTEHDTKLGVKHDYEIVERAKPGKKLDVAEETHIRQGGGPAKKGGKLANKRYQMSEKNYKAAGGTAQKPTP